MGANMIRRVLIPLDGSKLAEQVICHLLRFAATEQSELLLMSALSSSILPLSGHFDQNAVPNGNEVSEQVNAVAEQLNQKGFKVASQFLTGRPVESILHLAEERHVDLIAMSTHGRTGLGLMLLGSVAEGVVRNARPPVFLVPPGALVKVKSDSLPQTILLPLDGTPLAETAIPVACQLAQNTGAIVLLVRVVESRDTRKKLTGEQKNIDSDCVEEQPLTQQAVYYLERMKLRLQLTGVESRSQVVMGNPADAIAQIIHTESADVVVMSTHGRSGVERMVHGSVVSKVISNAICPLILMRGKVPVDVYERGGDAQLVTSCY